jgi:hypothetical protein
MSDDFYERDGGPETRDVFKFYEGHKRALADINAERLRQVRDGLGGEGWSPEHDDEHADGEMAKAAACYALGKDTLVGIGGQRIHIWPWEDFWWKPKDRRRDLVRAAALIVAEIERIDRAAKDS